ncbi:MAG: hypothetical protein NTW86_26985 [Candidatus Sumerlaeota bacterium]|nr:hypothetical protein [Candidatus Sumerlaeota bacterium]
MKLLPRKLLEWEEPVAVGAMIDQLEKRRRKWWTVPVLVVIVALFEMSRLGHGSSNPGRTPLVFFITIGVGFLIALFQVYIRPLLETSGPGTVIIYENSARRSHGPNSTGVRFDPLRSFAFFEKDSSRILCLTRRDGRAFLVGLPDLATEQKVEAILAAKGISKTADQRLQGFPERWPPEPVT